MLALGIAHHRASAPPRREQDAAAELLASMDGAASILLDDACRPVATTAAAADMLRAGHAVAVDADGILTVRMRGRMQPLHRVVRTADGQARPLVSLTLGGEHHGGPVWATLQARRSAEPMRWHMHLSRTMPTTAEALRERWPGMTPRQAQVCVLLLSGMAPTQAARHMGIAVCTLRSHLVDLYRMTGTTHAVALLAAVRW